MVRFYVVLFSNTNNTQFRDMATMLDNAAKQQAIDIAVDVPYWVTQSSQQLPPAPPPASLALQPNVTSAWIAVVPATDKAIFEAYFATTQTQAPKIQPINDTRSVYYPIYATTTNNNDNDVDKDFLFLRHAGNGWLDDIVYALTVEKEPYIMTPIVASDTTTPPSHTAGDTNHDPLAEALLHATTKNTPYVRYFTYTSLPNQGATPTSTSSYFSLPGSIGTLLMVAMPLENFILTDLLLPQSDGKGGLAPAGGFMVQLYNTCGQSFWYSVVPTAATGTTTGTISNTITITYVGSNTTVIQEEYNVLKNYEVPVDLWDTTTNMDVIVQSTAAGSVAATSPPPQFCALRQSIYPTQAYRDSFATSRTPKIFAVTVAVTFILVALVFAVYDYLVNERNKKVVENAARTNAIVTQLYVTCL
jgi:hypothetical protein